MSSSGAVTSGHGWLPAVIPAHARTFRTSDDSLRAILSDAGGRLQDLSPDVEIAEPGQIDGGAAQIVVTLDAAQGEGGSLPVRAVLRARGSVVARARAARVRRDLGARGFSRSSTVLWDIDQRVHLPWRGERLRDLTLAERLPQRALVVGTRAEQSPTVLDAAVVGAADRVGCDIAFGWPMAREGLMIALGRRHVVRVAVGPSRCKLELVRVALDTLTAADPPPTVVRAIPWIDGEGRAGVADWAVERRLPGSAPPPHLSAPLLEDCVDFLVALHRCGAGSGSGPSSIGEQARVVAQACPGAATAEVVVSLGARLEKELAGLQRGFGHGDFWAPNLLLEGGRLSGVVDWDSAGPDRLPTIDLLHLLLTARRQRKREYLGVGLIAHHLPWARAGGDAVLASYCRKLGITLDPHRLEALVLAYWLDRVSFELRLFANRVERPLWMRNNLLGVLEALGSDAIR